MPFSAKKNKKALSLQFYLLLIFIIFCFNFSSLMTNKKVKKCFVCLKLAEKNQNILSCSTCLQTIHLNCIKDKFCITKNMLWKCTFVHLHFFLVLVQIKNLQNYLILIFSTFFILLII